MKTASAETIKASVRGRRPRGRGRDIPREGTFVRGMYDKLMSSKALPVEIHVGWSHKTAIEVLRSTYGLDVRYVGRRRYMLVGEWFGRVYVDYLAEKIHEGEKHA